MLREKALCRLVLAGLFCSRAAGPNHRVGPTILAVIRMRLISVWVDADTFPSLFGTGTEDYFGQAYCSPEIYNHPYRAQSLAAGGVGAAKGLFSMVRAHVLDPIRFSKSLKFNLELWHWDEDAQVTFDTVAYFYLSQNGVDNLSPAIEGDFRLSPFGP